MALASRSPVRMRTTCTTMRSATLSSQRQFQSDPSVVVLCLVIGNQKYPLRIELRAGQQRLLQVHGSLLTQCRQVRIADDDALMQFTAQGFDFRRDYLRFGLDGRDRLGEFRLGA